MKTLPLCSSRNKTGAVFIALLTLFDSVDCCLKLHASVCFHHNQTVWFILCSLFLLVYIWISLLIWADLVLRVFRPTFICFSLFDIIRRCFLLHYCCNGRWTSAQQYGWDMKLHELFRCSVRCLFIYSSSREDESQRSNTLLVWTVLVVPLIRLFSDN